MVRVEWPELSALSVDAAKALARVDKLDCAVFLPGPSGREPVLYRPNSSDLAGVDYDRLRNSGVSQVYVSIQNLHRCEEALETNLGEILKDPHITPVQKAACVQSVGTAVVRDLVTLTPEQPSLDRADHVIDCVIGCVLADPAVSASLLSMSEHHR